jgi:hypothetical protein
MNWLDVLHVVLTLLALLVPVTVVGVAVLDLVLEIQKDHRSVGESVAWWSSRHAWFAFGLIAFYGVLLAHLFSQR